MILILIIKKSLSLSNHTKHEYGYYCKRDSNLNVNNYSNIDENISNFNYNNNENDIYQG